MRTHQGRMMIVAVIIAVAISAPSLFAQSPRLSASIPFDFYVSDRLFPAGTYTVAPEGRMDALRIFDDRGNSVYVMTMGLSDNRSINLSRLVFNRYGEMNFLATIYWEGYKAGRNLASSKTEKKIAQGGSPPSPVAVQLKK
jgi:hypothetical protein